MDANNDREISEVNNETTQEHLTIGDENLSTHQAEADEETELHTTPQTTQAMQNEGPQRLPTDRTSEVGGASERGKRCSCNGDSSNFTSAGVPRNQCMICGGEEISTRYTNTPNFNKSTANPVSTQNHLVNVLTQSYAVNLPSLPDTSLEDAACNCNNANQVESLVTGCSHPLKTPVHNVCQLSVQNPSPGILTRMFLFEKTYTERNEKWLTLYIIPENECEIYEDICQDNKESGSQQGFYSRQIPFVVSSKSEEFFTVYIQEQIKVSFEIENRFQENFVALEERNEPVFRVPVIQSASKNRVQKGAKTHFRVQYVGEPGKPCQEQGKITLTIDSTVQTTLFFSIAIWSSVNIHVDGAEQQGEQ